MKLKVLFLTLLSYIMMVACTNKQPQVQTNPLLEESSTVFEVPDFALIKPQHFAPALEQAILEHSEQIKAIVDNQSKATFENVILALDRSGEKLGEVVGIYQTLNDLNTSDKMQSLETELMPLLASHQDNIMMDEELFKKVEQVYQARNNSGLNPVQISLTEVIYSDFIRSGATLSVHSKARLKEINQRLATLKVQYDNNVFADHKAFSLKLDKKTFDYMPQAVIDIATTQSRLNGKPGRLWFTLDESSYTPFISSCDSTDLRVLMYETLRNRANNDDAYDNKLIVNEIILLRAELAHLLGYASYAYYALEGTMAKTPENVYSMINQIWKPALAKAKTELADLKRIKKRELNENELEQWDWEFYAEKFRDSRHRTDDQRIRQYFSVSRVRDGIFTLCNRLYGITFRPIVVPMLDNECMAYEVLDADNSHLGIMYFDLFARESKRMGDAWINVLRPKRISETETIASPLVSVNFNFPRLTNPLRSLLSLDQTLSFFREVGNALYVMLEKEPYNRLTGLETDFVQMPSYLLSKWAFDPDYMVQYAVHHSTGNPMSSTIQENIQKSLNYVKGRKTISYLMSAELDMDVHSIDFAEPADIDKIINKKFDIRRGLIEEVEPEYNFTNFRAIFSRGDGANYYAKLWSEIMAEDAFPLFSDNPDYMFDGEIGAKLRTDLLTTGLSEDAETKYFKFRGSDFDYAAYLKANGF